MNKIHHDIFKAITPFVNQKKLIEDQLKENGLGNVACGTVHAFQGDEKDVVLFSTVLTDQTQRGTYDWLKNNKELINVATSRTRDKLIILVDSNNLKRLAQADSEDDLYELIQYVKKMESHRLPKRKPIHGHWVSNLSARQLRKPFWKT